MGSASAAASVFSSSAFVSFSVSALDVSSALDASADSGAFVSGAELPPEQAVTDNAITAAIAAAKKRFFIDLYPP